MLRTAGSLDYKVIMVALLDVVWLQSSFADDWLRDLIFIYVVAEFMLLGEDARFGLEISSFLISG